MIRGKRVAVQGMGNKAMVQVERFVPRAIVTRLARKVHETG
jgi:glutamate dehydrogenase/leucine dehydrogenase